MPKHPVGLHKRRLSAWLPDICTMILTNTTANALGGAMSPEANLTAALIGQGPGLLPANKWLAGIVQMEILALPGTPAYPQASATNNNLNDLRTLVLMMLNHIGFIPPSDVPNCYEERLTPHMSMDEVVDCFMDAEIALPSIDKYGGDKARCAVLPIVIMQFCRSVVSKQRKRLGYAMALVTKAHNIGYNILENGYNSLNDHERDLFLWIAHGSASTHLQRTGSGHIVSHVPVVGRVQRALHADAAIEEAWSLYQSHVQAGPASNYVSGAVERAGKQTLYYIGAPIAPVDVSFGITEHYGPFIVNSGSSMYTIPASLSSNMAASMERLVGMPTDDQSRLFLVELPICVGGNQQHYCYSSINEPAVYDLVYITQGNSTDLPHMLDFEIRYASTLSERAFHSEEGMWMGPHQFVVEKALAGTPVGSMAVAGYGPPFGELLAPHLCRYVTSAVSATGMLARPTFSFVENIFVPDRANVRVLRELVDLSTLLQQMGQIMFVGAGREHVLVPTSWLLEEQANAEAFIIAQLGYNDLGVRLAGQSIRVSHNFFKFSSLLPAAAMPSMDPIKVAALSLG